ncbi:hypothetical protein [Benzoatithermus flavus]|uniref:Uncharacterized protein n=1 Tax=Benzoatithermus flavus TaxID=3108223 RepID=A0ABU8XYI9_9PROT
MAEVIIGLLLKPRPPGVDLCGALGVSGASVVVAHWGLRVDHDDAIHALFHSEA